MTVTSRTAAKAVMWLAGTALVASGLTVIATNRVARWEALVLPGAVLVWVVAGLWLRRENRRARRACSRGCLPGDCLGYDQWGWDSPCDSEERGQP